MTAFGIQVQLLRTYVWRYYDGLTDEEVHWEPAPGMWGVRRKTELRTPVPDDVAPGEFWLDGVRPRPDPEPFTTVAWRMAHLILGTWNWLGALSGRAGDREPEPSLPGDAEGLVTLWKSVLDEFVDTVCAYTEEDIKAEVPVGERTRPRAGIISHMTLEIALHSSEVGTLRHLKRAHSA